MILSDRGMGDELMAAIETMDSFDPGTIEHYGTAVGSVEYRICGLNSAVDFGQFKSGAGVVRGRIVGSLFDRRVGGTVLVCQNGDRVPFSLFGLMSDGVTATVVLDRFPST
jgi:hypothetical protein